ncbi:hybrid sensor histidine kinase/response regulator [Azospirillum agricola]|uniref:hybrid sensor histidine kinase/response regulator n=1 Tax=Azospirillum agricola TaxID=1720247 RepID=UPI000A1CBB11|nr:ATP-binding protein [Azospirillum agricola]
MRFRLMLLVAGVVAPLIVFAGAVASWLLAEQRQAAVLRMEAVAGALALDLDHELENALTLLETLAASEGLARGQLQDLRREALVMLQSRPLWSAVILSDAAGRPLMNTAAPMGAPPPGSRGLALLEAVRRSEGPVFSDLFVGTVQRRPLLAVAVPLRHRVFQGALSMTIPAETIEQRLGALALAGVIPAGWVALVADGDGTIVARSPGGEAGGGRTTVIAPPAAGAGVTVQSLDGVAMRAVARRSRLAGWTVHCLAPPEVVEGRPGATRWRLLGFGLMALAVSLGWAALFAWRRPEAAAPVLADAALGAVPGAVLDPGAGKGGARQGMVEHQLREAWGEAQAAQQEAEQANRAKTAFLAAASHDLRQPAQSLVLFAELLKTKLRGHPHAHIVDSLLDSADTLNRTLNGLLDISKIDAGFVRTDPEHVALAPLIDELRREFAEPAAARGLRLRAVACGVTVRTDPVLLARLLRHLVENALAFTERGGVLIGCRRHGSQIRLDVVDSGRGIPPEQIEAIFEAFVRLDIPDQFPSDRDRPQGSGLGLAIVRRLAAALGHRLEVASTVGRGTRVSIGLPLAAPRPDLSGAAGGEGAEILPPLRQPGLLLVIEDKLYVRTAMTSVLSEWGFEVVEAASGREAVRLLAGRCPDLIVADQRLHDSEGGDAAIRVVRAACGEGVPAVIVGADSSPAMRAAAREAGATLLGKPVSLHELRKVIRKELHRG